MGNYSYCDTPIGKLTICETNGHLTHLLFEDDSLPADYYQRETPILKEASKQLHGYFNGERKEFDLPINPTGTDFMQSVWSALRDIPYGRTRSYKDIAIAIGNNKAYRAVGLANNKNPIPIIIPCHRVIGSGGALVGYGGGLSIKTHLLELEKSY